MARKMLYRAEHPGLVEALHCSGHHLRRLLCIGGISPPANDRISRVGIHIRNRRKIQIEPVKSQVAADRPSHLAGLLRVACFANIPGARIFRQREGLMICQPGYRAALFINGHDHRYFGGALEIRDQGGKLVLVLNVLLKNCDAAHRILFQILPHGLRQRLFFRIQ